MKKTDLSKQVYLYSLDTSAFYTNEETEIHTKQLRLYTLKKRLKTNISKVDEELKADEDNLILKARKLRLRKRLKSINALLNHFKKKLIEELDEHEGIRSLRSDSLKENQVIGMFDSTLTRTIGTQPNKLSENLFVVRAFYYQILNDLISDGFLHNGEKYIYFSSSAGQIRTKKTVFIKESLSLKHDGALTCGLSIEEINAKGGMNINKLLAYKALAASASTHWKNFDIDRSIVVPDLETNVRARFDYIDRDTYEITPKDMEVPIEHTDGCGMILPQKSRKSFMVRLPFVKGLLAPFPFDKFANASGHTKVTDVYGKEWDIIEDRIQVIFTASQFKMKKFYDGWDDYKQRFKDNNCQAVKLNEEDLGGDATLNYQMLQTLSDVTDKELQALTADTLADIAKIGTDKDTMLKALGATESNQFKNYYQTALFMYPELLNDEHSKKIIKDKKRSMLQDAWSGKLKINGKYIYLIPDLYAFCERLFWNREQPEGLLKNGQVYTRIYEEGKVDILRSPHLYKEHSVRNNIRSSDCEEWFVTNGIYTSIFDPISRVLQFDNDGDKALVVQDDLFIRMAERSMEGVLPLFYDMGFAEPQQVTSENIYESLLLAFKANIGEVSNNITKVFNSENSDMEVVKWLTAENNYIIDYAKTLYMPERPDWVDQKIKGYIKSKLPYFFVDAKDKDKSRVEPINCSTVNRIRKYIPNKRIKFSDIAGEFDYRNLMSKDIEYVNSKIVNTYRKLDRSKKWLIKELGTGNKSTDILYVYERIREELKQIEPDEEKVADVLVKELYGRTKSPNKTTLWNCYGHVMVRNLRDNLSDSKQCQSCGKRISTYNTKKYCSECAAEITKAKKREWKRKR